MEHPKLSPSDPITLSLKREAPEFDGSKSFKTARSDGNHNTTLVGSSACHQLCVYCSSKQSALGDDHVKFFKSKTPRRVMFYSAGEWSDFPESVTSLLVNAFLDRKSALMVPISNISYLFDFLSMVLINLENGGCRSISWIDESNKCFFPSIFLSEVCYPGSRFNHQSIPNVGVDAQYRVSTHNVCQNVIKTCTLLENPGCNGEDEVAIVLGEVFGEANFENGASPVPIKQSSENNHEFSIIESQMSKETALKTKPLLFSVEQGGSSSQEATTLRTEEIKEAMLKQYSFLINDKQAACMCTLCCQLVSLEKDSKDFILVMSKFLSGLTNFANETSIVGIHRYIPKDSSALSRQQKFEKKIVITRQQRGDANMRYGWFGASKEEICQILLHGFGHGLRGSEDVSYGTGVYLMPENCSFTSVKYCDDDENGAHYMVLCQIIMGNMEKVPAGSKQISPSSPEFDSGVDDLLHPNCYVVWGADAATRIYPEFVVSFKLSPTVQECLAGSADIKGNRIVVTRSQKEVNVGYPGQGPSSAWISFSSLFAEIKGRVSPSTMELLELHYTEFQSKMVTRNEFVNKIRFIVGDPLLISTLKIFQQKPSAYPNEQPMDDDDDDDDTGKSGTRQSD